MAGCEFLQGCIFFNDKMDNMPSTANLVKLRYCEGGYEDCARYVVRGKLGKDKVPQDLFPNQTERASQIIAKG